MKTRIALATAILFAALFCSPVFGQNQQTSGYSILVSNPASISANEQASVAQSLINAVANGRLIAFADARITSTLTRQQLQEILTTVENNTENNWLLHINSEIYYSDAHIVQDIQVYAITIVKAGFTGQANDHEMLFTLLFDDVKDTAPESFTLSVLEKAPAIINAGNMGKVLSINKQSSEEFIATNNY